MERRPELEHYFDDFAPAKAVFGHNPREAQLEAAFRANAALRVQAEGLIAAYVAPESNCPVRRAGPTRGAVACGASVG